MGKFKTLGYQVLRINRGRAIVKSWGKKVDEFGMPYGKIEVFYDVCAYEDGELGDTFESFVTLREAIKYLFKGV